ncbi:hypothetical protein [Ralstonia sp. ASV6]|uniref:hypothetical protein n=1 Tax=Ralstonia sp. ASV6 TaxID=2795124 RepID=UPI0018EA335B|nr:hypothetical protein [Ralstonia sp. ASV6]
MLEHTDLPIKSTRSLYYFALGIAFLVAALVVFGKGFYSLAFVLSAGGVTPFFVMLLVPGRLAAMGFSGAQVLLIRAALVSLLAVAWAISVFAFVRIG